MTGRRCGTAAAVLAYAAELWLWQSVLVAALGRRRSRELRRRNAELFADFATGRRLPAGPDPESEPDP